MTADGESFCIGALVARATARKLRLHACGCMRLVPPKRAAAKWLGLVAVAERYADAAADGPEFAAAREASRGRRKPRGWDGDLTWAFQSDDQLRGTWSSTARSKQVYSPADPYYHMALFRHSVFEELIGPDPLPPCAPEWRTDTAVSLARAMYDAREFGAMPILADALQDAGCDSEPILAHCRSSVSPFAAPPAGSPASPPAIHVRGCWVLDLVLGLS